MAVVAASFGQLSGSICTVYKASIQLFSKPTFQGAKAAFWNFLDNSIMGTYIIMPFGRIILFEPGEVTLSIVVSERAGCLVSRQSVRGPQPYLDYFSALMYLNKSSGKSTSFGTPTFGAALELSERLPCQGSDQHPSRSINLFRAERSRVVDYQPYENAYVKHCIPSLTSNSPAQVSHVFSTACRSKRLPWA